VLHAQAVEEQFGTLLRDYNEVRDTGMNKSIVCCMHRQLRSRLGLC